MNDHIRCLEKACDSLGITHNVIGGSGAFISVEIHGKPHYFIANEVPFNSHMVSHIIVDKGYTYDLLHDVVRMPRTLAFLDPHCEEIFQPYVEYKSNEEIAEKIVTSFEFPIIVKRNSGSKGIHVFRCTTKEEVLKAIKVIFYKKSKEYDNVLLAQEHIAIDREFRVTLLQQEIVLMYEKDITNAKFVGNLSPLHWAGARAKIVDDADLQQRIQTFLNPIFKKLDLKYGGVDIALTANNELCLFEINSKPGYNYVLKDNGDSPLVELYTKMLKSLQGAA